MKAPCLAAMLGVAACSAPLPDGERGTASEPQTVAYAIAGVRTSPGTVHFSGLPRILNSSEATGPIVITTHVGHFVQPAMSATVTGVDPEAVSHAVGYNLTERVDLIAVSSATLKALESKRVEAYASFIETFWEARDPSTGALLGTGASFEPSGVFFQTVTARHARLPDTGLSTFVEGCVGLACTFPLDPEGEGDAGVPAHQVPGFVPSGGAGLLGTEGGPASVGTRPF